MVVVELVNPQIPRPGDVVEVWVNNVRELACVEGVCPEGVEVVVNYQGELLGARLGLPRTEGEYGEHSRRI
jgi:hypothetical protein